MLFADRSGTLTAYIFKEYSEVHGKVVYLCYYPHDYKYVKITMHDEHVNAIVKNMVKAKFQIKVRKPSDLILKYGLSYL